MNNTKIGSQVEKEVAQVFRSHNYWAHVVAKSNTGAQPVDVIAMKKNISWLVDAKHVRTQDISFPLSRIEDNQWISMQYAYEFAQIDINHLGFVIKFDRLGDTLYWLGYELATRLRDSDTKSIHSSKLRLFEEVLNENDN